MIPRFSAGASGWVSGVEEALRFVGCALVTGIAPEVLLARVRDGLRVAHAAILREIGQERLSRAGESGIVRIPMRFDPVFFEVLELPGILQVVDATVSPTAILHLQNGLLTPPPKEQGTARSAFHPDFPRVLNGYLCSVNALLAVDEFAADNGATLVVPGTQQSAVRPSEEYLRENAIPAEGPAGSVLFFDSTLWHAAGAPGKGERFALNHQFTRSYIKQQIDYVRALGDDVVLRQSPRTQQLLGWYTRVVTSLDEFYRPGDERLYRGGQG